MVNIYTSQEHAPKGLEYVALSQGKASDVSAVLDSDVSWVKDSK